MSFTNLTEDRIAELVREIHSRLDEGRWAQYVQTCRQCADAWWVGAPNVSGLTRSLPEVLDVCAQAKGAAHWRESIAAAPYRLVAAQIGSLMGYGSGGYECGHLFNPGDDHRFCKAVVAFEEQIPPEFHELRRFGVARRGDVHVKIVPHPTDRGFGIEVITDGVRADVAGPGVSLEAAQDQGLAALQNAATETATAA